MADQPDDQRHEAGAEALTPPAQAIAAIATAPGRGGVGIVRVSGSPLADFARTLVGRVPTPRRALRAQFSDASGEPIDDGLALFFPAPHSYTGEDVLELHAHGGPVVLQQLLARCLSLGARLAEPGEFTRRAFLNDKLDLAQAEAVADLIDASTTAAARSALRSLRGEFSRVLRGLVDQLIELRMLVEATLDFPEEEIDPVDRFDAKVRLQNITAALRRAQAQSRKGALLRAGLTAVLVGRPNVGKSSILNRLAGDDIVIVTPIPGTTRDAIRQTIQVGGIPIHVVDTAGLRETEDPVERIGIERTWEAVRGADVVLEIADARAGVAPEDEQLLSRVPDTVPRILVLNKADLRDEPFAPPPGAVLMSARTGEGVDALQQALLHVAGWQAPSEDVFMARERHLQALARAGEALERAAAQFAQAELFAEELRLAQRELDLITGEFSADDLLGEIFTRFCIGK